MNDAPPSGPAHGPEAPAVTGAAPAEATAPVPRADLRRRLSGAMASFTPFVPELSALPIADDRRWYVAWSAPLAEFVAEVLHRAGVPARAVKCRAEANGDLGIYARMPATRPAEYLPGSIRPLAFLHHGPTEAEVDAALAWLAAREQRSAA